jgi:hypothetical protein
LELSTEVGSKAAIWLNISILRYVQQWNICHSTEGTSKGLFTEILLEIAWNWGDTHAHPQTNVTGGQKSKLLYPIQSSMK